MQGVIETGTFIRQAEAAGLTDEECQDIIGEIAQNPLAGDVIPGTGGARKIRFAKPNSGKRGGYRTIHYYAGDDVPVFLLAVYDKKVNDNISKAGCNALKKELNGLAADYLASVKAKVVKLKRRRQ